MTDKLTAVMEYAGLGWKVVPLKDGKSKHPTDEGWQNSATDDAEVLAEVWEADPDRNIGIKLGPDSGIIDIECDSQDAELLLLELCGGDYPYTPTYKSRRGKHRLMKWRNDLPEPTKNVFKIGELEFRTGNGGKGAQSVFPPSTHPDGKQYEWVISPSEADVEEISDEFLAAIWARFSERSPDRNGSGRNLDDWKEIAGGVGEGKRNETAASFAGRLLASLKDIHDGEAVQIQWVLFQNWNKSNKPPLAPAELESVFRSILGRERQKVTNERYGQEFTAEAALNTNPEVKTEWRLEIVDSKPRTYRLYSPLWTPKAKRGYIELTSNQMHSPDAIRTQALEQADTWVPGTFKKLWNGSKDRESLARELVQGAQVLPAPLENKRDIWIAEQIYEHISKARDVEDEKSVDKKRPCKLPDGRIVFAFAKMESDIRFAHQGEKIKRSEFSAALEMIGASEAILGARGARRRYKLITPEKLKELETLIGM